MPYEIQLPDGTIVGDIPDDLDPSAAKAQILRAYPNLAIGESRTIGETAKDVAASFGSGVGSLLQIPGQVAGLVTGNIDETTGLQGAGRRLQQISEEAKSPVLRAKEAFRSQKISQAEGFFDEMGTAIGQTLKDPALLGSFIFEQVPNLIGTMGGGLLTKGVVKTLMVNTTEEAMKPALAKAGVRGAIGTGAIMQGADIGTNTFENVYNELISQGVDQDTAMKEALASGRTAAIQAGALTLGTSFGAGATIERALTRGMAGVPKSGIIRGTLGETLSEAVEEGGGQLASNIQLQQVAPETDIMKGVGAAAGLGAVGGALFGLPASFVNKANAIELERAKAQLEEARRKAAETLQPQNVGTTIFPSERNQFAPTATSELSEEGLREKYGIASPEQIKDRTFDADRIRSFGISPKANLYKNQNVLGADIANPQEAAKVKAALQDYLKKYSKANPTIRKNIEDYLARPEFQPLPVSETTTQITEATTTPEADAQALRDRMIKGFRDRPEIKKIYDEYDKFLQSQDVDKAALSAFNNIFSAEVLKGLGINPVATIYQDPEVLNADLSVPENADRVRTKLMAFKDQSKSQSVKDNIDTYLNRAEFLTPQYIYDILNPPLEVERKAEGQEQFVFIDPEGNVQSHYGTIVQRGKKRFAKYKDGERELTENVLVNPNPDQVEILELYKRKEKLEKEPDEFKKWMMGFGIDPSERADIGIDKRIPNRLFRKGGLFLDDLIRIAIEQQILSPADVDLNSVDGGVSDFRELIRTSVDGGFVPTPQNIRVMRDLESIQNNIEYLENKLKGAPEEAIAEEFTEPNAPATTEDTKYEIPKTPYTDKFIADAKKVSQAIRSALDQMGLKDVAVNFEDAIIRRINGEMTEVNGEYFDKLINLSLSGDNIFRTMNHEAIHAMKDIGFFTDAQWSLLTEKAKKEWMEKYKITGIEGRYNDASEETQIEEAIADAFADMQTQPASVKSLMSKIINILKRIGNALRGQGYQTAEDIFAKAAAGELKKDTATKVSGRERMFEKKMKASFEGVDEAYAEAVRKQFTQEKATVGQKFESLKDNFFERMITGIFDEFRAIKKFSTEGYMMARLSKSIDGGLQGLLEYGQVYIKDGALDIRPNTKGLMKILEPLGIEVDQYQAWKALSRDAQMSADKRSFDEDLVNGRNKLTQGTLNGKPRKAIYEQALKEENELNKSVLDVALQANLIDRAAYQRFSNDIYYIPFYKEMEDGSVDAVNASSKLTGQYFSKALKGGPKKTNDLMENVLLNWSHILSASMKNMATNKIIQDAESMGAAERAKPMDGKYPANTIKFMEKGKTVHFTLSDPDLVDAISTISYLGPKSAFLDIAKGFTNALRYGVTLSPAYKIRNLIRDSMSSAAVSELGPNMLENVYNGLRMSRKGDPTFMSALAGGGIFEMGTAHEGDQAKMIKRLIDKGIKATTILDSPEKIKGKLQDILNAYNELGNKFENANRLALYKKLRDSGKSHLEASFAARDLMDFSMQGQFRTIKVIASVVPFFNARLQGLYKLGRDGITPTYRLIYNATTGKETSESDKQKAQRFMTMSSAIMLASILLYGIYKDDEDFQRRESWDRDNFWWFKIGDVAFRIPKPFEIGALGTIAERTYEQLADEGVEGKVFAERLNHILMETFSLNPMPQMIKPLIDIYANKDSFTGAPIESAGMERLSKQERMTNRTSGVAVALGGVSEGAAKVLTFNPDAQGISPIQMDYFIKAYLGWMGATIASTADLAMEPFKEGTRVRKPFIDTVAMGFIKTEPETQSKYMTQFYENNAKLQSALADMRHYAELGDMEKVTKILEEKGDKIALSKVYDKATKQLAELRKQNRIIENSKDISTEDKRAEMNRIKILMSDIAKQMEDIRKSK